MIYNSMAQRQDNGRIAKIVADNGSYEYKEIIINFILNNESSLDNSDPITINFNEVIDNSLENLENGDIFILRPGQ